MSRICEEVLELDQVSTEASFCSLGGNSITALAVVAQLGAAGLSLRLADILAASPLDEVAARIASPGAPAEAEDEEPGAELALTPPQRVLMSLPNRSVARGADLIEYLKLDVFEVTGRGVTPEAATHALRALVERHDALRTRLATDRRILLDLPLLEFVVDPVFVHDGTTPLNDVIIELLPEYRSTRDPLVRLCLVEDVVAGRVLLLFAAHHLVCDLISWQVLCRDLDTVLDQLLAGRPAALPAVGATWGRWARAVERYERDGRVLDELPYWAGLPVERVTDVPLDLPAGSNSFELQDGVVARSDHSEGLPGQVVIAALADVLADWQGNDTVLIDTRYHGRHVPELGTDVAGTVGAFTLAHPLLLRLPRDVDDESLVTEVLRQLEAVPSAGLGYGLLRRPLGEPHPAIDRFPSAQVLLDYYGGRFWRPGGQAAVLRPSGVALVRRRHPGGTRPYVFRVHVSTGPETLDVSWEFSRGLHEPATVVRLAQAMVDRIAALAAAHAGDRTHRG
ncbi:MULTISPECIES: condensation domain-containing protein [Actinosynnema]|uniref:condensation domain-containing protein n=1 Tax=Actinosynnema TaxID=40566 RepID=UPI0020A53888|nr:condensation domain-containing protein [Actinosynnema pretiosum]MCP2097846.1 Phosphopantetheine attachment site [Actinosynnema pretiosum]